MTRPRMVIFAGPNGSGKSSLTRLLIARDLLPPAHIDPDRLAQDDGDTTRAATPAALLKAARLRETWLAEGRDFCFETVFSHRGWLDFCDRARRGGYEVWVYFIGIGDPAINVTRVRARAARKGHAIPDHVVIDRWHRSMGLLAEITERVDRLLVFDNERSDMADAAILPVASSRWNANGLPRIEIFEDAPEWVRTRLFPR